MHYRIVETFQLTDIELASFMKGGSSEAFEEIFRRYNRLLYTHAYNKLRDREEAKDIVQEVFANLWSKSQQYELSTTNLSGYLYASVRNRIFDILSKKRSASNYLLSLQDYIDQHDLQTDHRVREQQLQGIIEKAIDSLPPRMKLVFELSRKEHLSHKEIAQQLNISDQTVTDQIKKALKILRTKLGIMLYLMFLFGG